MSQTYCVGVDRFGSKEAKPSKSGQYRLNKYLQRLKQTEPETKKNNNNNNDESENENQNEKKSSKHKLNHSATSNPIKSPPNKKIKLSHNVSNGNSNNHNINNNEMSIEHPKEKDIKDSKKPIIKGKKDKKNKHNKKYHPIYDITSFPRIRLPKVVNPEKTLMPQPIWMQKGNKIISDISKQDNESENENENELLLNRLRLDIRLINALKSEGYKSYFPVQMNVIPAIIRGITQRRDIAVCAPTGSGKTLSYVLPICHILCKELSETSHDLRALVVSPSRDLALQLFLVFEKFGACVGLNVGLSAGQTSLKHEQAMISKNNNKAIDVLICTPGRLVDHLNHTTGFHLKNLQFLVLDEADRLLLEGTYNDWLFRVYRMIESQAMIETYKYETPKYDIASLPTYNNKICLSWRGTHNCSSKPYLLKILLSATLTHNPKIISSLKLNNPLYFGSYTNKQYLIPSSIKQLFICCFGPDKLCNFISLIDLLQQQNKTAVCFCDTVTIAHRLKRIAEIAFNVIHKLSIKIGEFSRLVPDRQRPHILRQFKGNKINFLICSDALSRGLDLPSLDCVINYECPKNVETYVHRIGRTARGIGNGTAYSIIMQKEKRVLREMLKCVENGNQLKEYQMEMKVIRFHRKYMDKYSELLNKVLNQEQDGELDHNESLIN